MLDVGVGTYHHSAAEESNRKSTLALKVPRLNCLLLFLLKSLVEDSASSWTQRSRRSRPYCRSRKGGRDELACTSGRVQ
jgi:hypothetical protein